MKKIVLFLMLVCTGMLSANDAKNTFFKDNKNGTMTDMRSGLMWLKNANISGKEMAWQSAMDYCNTLKAAGYTDWRLPTKEEFELLTKGFPTEGTNGKDEDPDWCPLLKSQGFTNVQCTYWTSTESSKDIAWSISLCVGLWEPREKAHKGDHVNVWPVRAK
jgi:formylglycine-generating enzyme required for sulfatase activity